MKIVLSEGITVSSKNFTKKFAKAVQYLLDTYPTKNKPIKFLTVRFYEADLININANADYGSPFMPTHIDAEIRVAYGKAKLFPTEEWATYLFHEYKHLLQEDELQREYHGKEYCVEAQAWAEQHVPAYLEFLKGAQK